MSDQDFTAGYLTGQEHRNITDADREAYGQLGAGGRLLKCPHQTASPVHKCDFTEGWREAWT